jgi:hypothetical protein
MDTCSYGAYHPPPPTPLPPPYTRVMEAATPSSEGDSLAAMLSQLTSGGDSAQFTMLLQLCCDRVKACPVECWTPVWTGAGKETGQCIPAPLPHCHDLRDGEEPEAEGVDVSAVLGSQGLSPQYRAVGEDDSSDDDAAPLKGVIPMTDVEVSRRKSVWHWFSGLPQDEKDKVLTVTDKVWTGFLLKLVEQVRRKGDGVFIIEVPDAFSCAVDAALAGVTGNVSRPRRSSFSGYVLETSNRFIQCYTFVDV